MSLRAKRGNLLAFILRIVYASEEIASSFLLAMT